MATLASIWPPRIAALLLWAAAALSVAYWGQHWQLSAQPVQAAAGAALGEQPINTETVARALGAPDGAMAAKQAAEQAAQAPEVTESSRFVLQGVLAGGPKQGSALLAVDGKPAKPFAVGAVVADGWVLRQAVSRRAVLSRDGVDLEFTLPALPPPATTSKKAL